MFARRLVAGVSLLTVAVAVLVARGSSCSAQVQSVPNLSGTWELVEINGKKKNKQPPGKFPQLTLVIGQEGSEIRVTKKRTQHGIETVQEYSYYTDGRGEKNTGRTDVWGDDVRGFDSVSGWQNDRLVIRYDNKVKLRTGASTSSAGYSIVNSAVNRNDELRLGRAGMTLVMTSATVQIQSRSITGGLSDARLESSPGRDHQSSYGEFGKTKLVFRKI